MAITFIEERKKIRRLIPVLAGIILMTAIVLWFGFFVEERFEIVEVKEPVKKIEINFQILKDPILKDLEPFEEIKPFEEIVEEKIGRENPFLSY